MHRRFLLSYNRAARGCENNFLRSRSCGRAQDVYCPGCRRRMPVLPASGPCLIRTFLPIFR